MNNYLKKYLDFITKSFDSLEISKFQELSELLFQKMTSNKTIAICGNGGSGANANHIANDLILCMKKMNFSGSKIISLNANNAIFSCIANDYGYESVFSEQINLQLDKTDFLITLSGSGNSKNIIEAINLCNSIGIETFGIFGYDGGVAKEISKNFIHIKINDMQVVEDMQTIIFHNCIKYILNEKK